MLEMLINPKKVQGHPWEMFFIGLFYASLSILLVHWIFGQDIVLVKYSGIFVVTFTVMFSLPFVYYTIKLEEEKISPEKKEITLLKEHKKAIYVFLWLFVGFVVAFSFWGILLSSDDLFKAQIETYCLINRPTNIEGCVTQYTENSANSISSSFGSPPSSVFVIFFNNIYVLISTLLFSLIFGAGVIFILAWNATVIAAAVGIFTNSQLSSIPFGLLRYLLHGIPEIASYFVVALAGGIVSAAVIKHEFNTPKFWEVIRDSLSLIVISVLVLFIAALLEVYITPLFF